MRTQIVEYPSRVDAATDRGSECVGLTRGIEDHLAMPMKVDMLGIEVVVERINVTDDDPIVASRARGTSRRRIPITEPRPGRPNFTVSVHVYRRWAHGR
jgi:hypothetical protein